MAHVFLTWEERVEQFHALTERFKEGEIGAVDFVNFSRALSIEPDDIERAKKLHVNSNVLNWRNRTNI